MTPTLVIGTGNKKKGGELAALVAPLGLAVRTLADFPPLPPVDETGRTFADNAELKAVGFSRQKTTYGRHLAQAVIDNQIDLDGLQSLSDSDAKAERTKLKGVGEWTSDIYLLMAMLRPDVMPRGDIALHAAYQKLTGTEKRPGSDEFIQIAEK